MTLSTWVSKRTPNIVVYLLVFTYAGFFSFLSIRSLESLSAYGYDLAIFDQVIWNTTHGRFFLNTVMLDSPSLLGHHFSPLLIIFVPLYWVWSDARVLLIVQSGLLALGALPVFWFARERLGRWGGVALVVMYLLFPPLQAGNLFDFHEVALAVPLLAFALWFLFKKNNLGFASAATLTMLVKEDMPLLIVMMGIYALIIQRRWKFGLAWVTIGVAVFAVVVYGVIPRSIQGEAHPFLSYYSDFGTNPLQIVWNVVTNPAHTLEFLGPQRSVAYIFDLLYPFGLFSLFAPFELFLCLPNVAMNLLSNFTPMHRLALQYPLALVPFITMSAIGGMARVAGWLVKRRVSRQQAHLLVTTVALVGTLVAQRNHGLTPISWNYTLYDVSPHAQRVQSLIQQIPADASVSAPFNLLPFLTHRIGAYTFERFDQSDYVLLDASTTPNKDNINQWIRDELMKDFHIVTADDGWLLLQRSVGDRRLPDKFFTFARVVNPPIQNQVHAVFGDAFELLGYDVRYYEWELPDEPQLFIYLRALRPINKNYFILPYLVDENGKVVGAASYPQATAVWYPTTQWRVGEIVRVRVNTVSWWSGATPQFGIALGIIDGDDPWNVDARLIPTRIESPAPIVLPSEGTLIQLATFSCDLLMRRQFTPDLKIFTLPTGVTRADEQFNNAVALSGYQIEQTKHADSKIQLDVTLFWQARDQIPEAYTVFVHVIGEDGNLIAQHDSPPNNGNTPTTVWSKGEIIRDRHEIVFDNANLKSVTIEIGLYNSANGVRVPLIDGKDSVALSSFAIR